MSLSNNNWVGFLSLCNCLLRSVYLCAILRGRIKALYYNRSINTMYIYVIICVLCVPYMRCGYIKACNNKGIYRTWAYITAIYNTVGYIDTVYISMGI